MPELTEGQKARLLIGEIKKEARENSIAGKAIHETYTQALERLARERGYRTLAALQAIAKQS